MLNTQVSPEFLYMISGGRFFELLQYFGNYNDSNKIIGNDGQVHW